MKLDWKESSGLDRPRESRSKELWVFGDPEPDGGIPYSYVGLVKPASRINEERCWATHIHELESIPYWGELNRMTFKSRAGAMREMRKRFNVAWVVATPEERTKIWDGYK